MGWAASEAGRAPSTLPEGEYDFSLQATEYKETRTSKDMMLEEWVVDNGPDQGAKVTDFFVAGTDFGEQLFNEKCLAMRKDDGSLDPVVDEETGELLCEVDEETGEFLVDEDGDLIPVNCGGYAYEGAESPKEFVKQFVQTPPLRVRARVYHEYDIETDKGWKRRVKKAEFDAHTEGGGRGSVKPKMRVVGPPAEPAELELEPKEEKAAKKPGFPGAHKQASPSGDGAAPHSLSRDSRRPSGCLTKKRRTVGAARRFRHRPGGRALRPPSPTSPRPAPTSTSRCTAARRGTGCPTRTRCS